MSARKMNSARKDGTMPGKKPSGESPVYVIFRFKSDVAERVRTACFKHKNIIANSKGRVVGIANHTTMFEGTGWSNNYGLLVMEFKSDMDAQLWFMSDKYFRNEDWPIPSSGLNMIVLPLTYRPPKDALTFQLIELSDYDCHFQQKYVDKVTPLMDEMSVKHGVVATRYGSEWANRGWIDNKSYVLLHAYEKPSDVDAFYDSDKYHPLKEYRQAACRTRSIVFTLDPKLIPPTACSHPNHQQ